MEPEAIDGQENDIDSVLKNNLVHCICREIEMNQEEAIEHLKDHRQFCRSTINGPYCPSSNWVGRSSLDEARGERWLSGNIAYCIPIWESSAVLNRQTASG